MQPIIFTFDGMSDLLVNNPQTADRLNPWSQLIAELTGKKKRIEYDGPRDVEGMWNARRFVDTRDAVPAGKRVIAVRAKFPVAWSVRLEAMFDPDQVNERDLKSFAELAGRIVGIGTYRQRFGRFTASVQV
jgi:hypothetical protein